MIRAIIFDCFGVLVQGTLDAFYDRHFGDDATRRQAARDADHAASRGHISYDEWLQQLGELAGISAEQVKVELEDNPPNIQLLDYIEHQLKPHYRIGMLSNAAANWMDELFTAEQQKLFDDIVLSYDVQLAKPDERIYTLAAERLGVLPEGCVFVDDIERFCTGAEDVGMQAIHYKNFAQFERELKELLD